MARTRVSKTVTVGEIKFKPQSGRERSTPGGPERYWQGRRYVGVVDGKPKREQVFRGWARADQLPGIAANLVGGVASPIKTSAGPGLATLDDLRNGTVAMLIKAWRGERKTDPDYSEHTRKHDRTLARRLTAVVGDLRLAQVDSTKTGTLLRRELRKEFAVSTTKATLTGMSTIWGWALKHGIVERPLDLSDQHRRLRDTQKRGENTGTREKPTPDEEAAWAIADALDAAAPKWASLAYRLLMMTGGRIGEIAVLTWGDVQEDSIRLTGKTGPRRVYIDGRALAPIHRARGSEVPSSQRVLSVTVGTARKHLGTYITAACEAAEVPRITPHAMRRFAVQRYIREGIAPSDAAVQLGQTPEVMLRHYAQVTAADQKNAARKAALGIRPEAEAAPDEKVVKLFG